MARQLQECAHCKGKKQCTRSGGRSCDVCLRAAGRKPREWATVRCSYCGGMGKIWIEIEEKEQAKNEKDTQTDQES